jgi:hypothetical protein
VAEFLAALAKQGKPGEFAYVDELKAYIYLKVGRPSVLACACWPRLAARHAMHDRCHARCARTACKCRLPIPKEMWARP